MEEVARMAGGNSRRRWTAQNCCLLFRRRCWLKHPPPTFFRTSKSPPPPPRRTRGKPDFLVELKRENLLCANIKLGLRDFVSLRREWQFQFFIGIDEGGPMFPTFNLFSLDSSPDLNSPPYSNRLSTMPGLPRLLNQHTP